MELTVLPTADAVAAAAADGFVSAARDAVAARGRFIVALSGGRTPDGAFALLRESPRVDRVPWGAVDVFWTDERAVDPDSPLSNARRAQEVLLDHAPGLRAEAIHRMRGEGPDLDAAARAYEDELREAVPLGPSGVPEFDLVWLGMGADGHTASLCPNDPSLEVTDRWVVPTWPRGLRDRPADAHLPGARCGAAGHVPGHRGGQGGDPRRRTERGRLAGRATSGPNR